MNKKISETPDKWVVIKIENTETFYKVFGSWAGGYLDGDRWKLNSGIVSVEEDDDNYYFTGHSGSCYKCNKNGYGVMTSYSQGVLNDLIENSYKVDTKAEILSEKTDWINLIKP